MDSLREIQIKFLSSAACIGKITLKQWHVCFQKNQFHNFYTGFHLQNMLFKMLRPKLGSSGALNEATGY